MRQAYVHFTHAHGLLPRGLGELDGQQHLSAGAPRRWLAMPTQSETRVPGIPSTRRLFPLIRLISGPITPLVAATPVTPNQLTWLSLGAGLCAAAMIAMGGTGWQVGGALLFVASYVLDNIDGEIARLKNLSSRFGAVLDTVVDWLVHTVLFVAIGLEHSSASGQGVWLWLGIAAGAGGSINFVIGRILERRDSRQAAAATAETASSPRAPRGPWDWTVYCFRELSRADFCFIVLLLAALDLVWVLLPAAAVGAQVYWLMIFVKGARDYHV